MTDDLNDAGISLRQLAHFVAIADQGTIGGAADGMYMSRSAVAASLTELERGLGADLCIRKRAHGVTLTPTGRLVLERARLLLADAAELGHIVRGDEGELFGPLVIGCFITLGPTVLPKLLSDYEALHPQVSVNFVEGPQDVLVEGMRSGEIDMALMYDLGDLGDSERLVLDEPRGYALFGAGHPLAELDKVPMASLAEEPLVLFSQPPSADYAMSAFIAQGLKPHVRHRTYSYELTRSIVARGQSYAILVQRPTNKSSYEGLPIIEREVDPPLPSCPIVLAWPRGGRLSPRAQAMVRLAGRVFDVPTPEG